MKKTIDLILVCVLGVAVSFPSIAQESAPTSDGASDSEPAGTEGSADKSRGRLPFSHPRAAYPANDGAKQHLLSSYLPANGMRWLENGDQKSLAYWQKDRSGDPKGALLILHAEGTSPIWPVITKPLHDSLPDYGWATLALALPDPDQPEIAKRTLPIKTVVKSIDEQANAGQEGEQAEPESEAPDAADSTLGQAPQNESAVNEVVAKVPTEQIIESRLEAALRFLHDRGQFNIAIMGDGVSAIQAQTFLQKITPKIDNPRLLEEFEKPIRAMILVNSRNRLPSMEQDFNNWFTDEQLPVLDIFVHTDPRNQHDARKRKVLARQQTLENYQQVRLGDFGRETTWGENRLSRRIRSFLVKNISGVEIKKARIKQR